MLICEYCGRSFDGKSRTCSRRCAAKLGSPNGWPIEAEDWLEERAGLVPLSEITMAYRQIAEGRGWPLRGKNAIRSKLLRLGHNQRCELDNVTRAELARMLGIGHGRVKNWTKSGLKCRWLSRTHTAVQISDVRQFLLRHPDMAIRIDPDKLAWVVGEPAAQKIVSRIKSNGRCGLPRPVVNLTTGKQYGTIAAAARDSFVQPMSLSSALRRGKSCAGYQWAYLEDRHE